MPTEKDHAALPENSYPLIEDYAFISDCHCGALISRDGSVDWCCMPRFDDDSSFGRLLDWGKGGHFSICPTAPYVVSRRYLPSSEERRVGKECRMRSTYMPCKHVHPAHHHT